MPSFALEIVTPERVVYRGQVSHVQAPGSEGSFGVLAGHVPFLTSLQVGALHFVEESGGRRVLAVSGGFAQVAGEAVIVLAETAEEAAEIDVERARRARERAEQRLASPSPEIDVARAQAALARALNRLEVSGRI